MHLRAIAGLTAVVFVAVLASCDGDPSGSDGGRPSRDAGALSCEPPEELCSGACVDPRSNPMHCGRCGETCPLGQFCANSICTAVCTAELTACGAACVDLMTDKKHCADCNTSCPRDRECRAASCVCPQGYSDCSDLCVDTNSDVKNCGRCGMGCALDEICSAGMCVCAGGTRETDCNDGADNDCDDLVDCTDPDCQGASIPCMGACGPGLKTCGPDGMFGKCEGGEGTMEICGDGIDQDCDGVDQRNVDMWEPNDSCAECRWIGGPDVSGMIHASFDSVDDAADCYFFQAQDDAFYPEAIIVQLTEVPVGDDYDIYLYPSSEACESRTPIAASEFAGNSDELIIWSERFGTNDSGAYYLRVVRFAGHSCTDEYLLTLSGLN